MTIRQAIGLEGRLLATGVALGMILGLQGGDAATAFATPVDGDVKPPSVVQLPPEIPGTVQIPPASVAEKADVPAPPVRKTPPPAPAPVKSPERKSPNPKTARTEDTTAVLDQLIAADSKQAEQNRKDSQDLFERAKALESTGKPAEAVRLARQAKTLNPANADLMPFINRVQKDINQRQAANAPKVRARAHLAAALARANDLNAQRRYASQEDLLNGVIEACALFQEPAKVENYRRAANDQLNRLAAIRGLRSTSPPAESVTANRADAIRMGFGVAAPENFRRLLPVRDFEMPRWYRSQKAALAKPLNVDYRQSPVALVFDDLADRAKLQLLIDTPVSESRAHLNATVDLRATDIPTETLLNIACAKTGLEYVIMEKAIVITSSEKALEYAHGLPEVVRDHWAAARMLFPDIDAALLASQTSEKLVVDENPSRADLTNTPSYLVSGKALVEHIRALVK